MAGQEVGGAGPSSYRPATLPMPAQTRLAGFLGLDLGDDPEEMTAARLLDALASAIRQPLPKTSPEPQLPDKPKSGHAQKNQAYAVAVALVKAVPHRRSS